MRLQKILIIAIFVLILTVGAVSASDNNQTSDSLTVNDDTEIDTLDKDDSNYDGDVSLSMDDKDEKLAVGTEDPSMNVIVDDIMEGEDAIVNVSLESDATGDVSVGLTGANLAEPVIYVSTVTDGLASFLFLNLLAGNYTVTTTYPGDGKYASATINETLTVMPGVMFKNLQTLINDDTTGEITLDRDYYGNSTEIVISKNITINGNGHTLNANGSSRIFHITAGYVVINNLTFVNSFTESDGGAVYFDSGSTGIVTNCNFTNNTINGNYYVGGAVCFSDDSYGTVTNCNFVNNTVSENGCCIVYFDNGTLTNCNFTGNNGDSVWFHTSGVVLNCDFTNNFGNAIYVYTMNSSCNVADCNFTNTSGESVNVRRGNVTNCKFTNSRMSAVGMSEGNLINCSFTNNNVISLSQGNVINCSFAYNYNSDEDGGAITIDSGNVTGCSFIGNSAFRNGGAITIDSGNVTDCYFANNTVYMGGGGAIFFKNFGNVMDCNFIDNMASKEGGGVSFYNSGTITNCNFTNNTATDGGGAICFSYSNYGAIGNVINCNFTNNSANMGGAIHSICPGNVTDCNFVDNAATGNNSVGGAVCFESSGYVENCNFVNNTAYSGGGAVYFWGSGNVTNCNFVNNTAGYGGAVYFDENGNVTNCNFVNNTANEYGGAIFFNQYSYGIVINCNFVDNKATIGKGGALYFADKGIVSNSIFINNTADEGGAIEMMSGNVTYCNFINNTAYSDGGAIWGCDNVENCNFTSNSAPNGNGGAIYWANDDGRLTNSTFISNTALYGGAVEWIGSNGKITDSIFSNNTAETGGAIFWEGNNGNIIDSMFSNNTAGGNGGAVYSTGSYCIVSNSNFTDNLAEFSGGAIYWYGAFNSKYNTVDGSIFTNNTAHGNAANAADTRGGGAIYWSENGERGTVKNSKFYYNSVQSTIDWKVDGGAILWDKSRHALVDNCIFVGNFVTTNGDTSGTSPSDVWAQGGAMYLRSNGNYTVMNCLFENCSSSKEAGALYIQGLASGSVRMILLENLVFINNVAYAMGNYNINGGGAIQIKQCTNSVFHNLTFINNTANRGGALCVFNTVNNLVVDGVTFDGNKAFGNGGGIYASSKFTANNMTFSNCEALQDGGAVYVTGSSAHSIIQNSTFTHNTAGENGGAIYGNLNVTIGHSSFTDNTANLGGAIYNCTHEMCTFEANAEPQIYPNSKMDAPMTITVEIGEDLMVIVTLPSDATGNITVTGMIQFAYTTATITNGSCIIPARASSAGQYEIRADYGGDVNYLANSTAVNITVPKKNTPMIIAAEVGEDLMVNVTLPSDATGTVNITVDGMNYALAIVDGLRTLYVSGLSAGEYDIMASYGGDENYLPTSNSTHVTISKTEPVITVDANNVEYGQTESVKVTLPSDATGSVEFTLLNGNSQVIDNKNSILTGGTASYTLPELNVGRYTLNTQYFGDSRYDGSLSCSTFYVSPKISITPDVTIGDDGVITMDLGNVTGSIIVYLDWEKDGSQTIRQGKFVYHLPTWAMTVGNHTIYFQYEGNSFDENVFNQWSNETGKYEPILYHFFIHKKQSESEAETKGEILEVILEDENGNVLVNATGNIEFTILNEFTHEISKVVVEIVNGIASLDISQFKDGSYIISWYYAGDDKHVPMSDTKVLEISRKVSRITAGDLSMVYSSSQAYSVTVYGADGYPVSGVPVTFLINNRAFRTVTTDRNGFASVAVTQAPGTYKITARSQTVSVTKKLAVMHVLSLSNVKVKRTAKKITIKATLKKVNGKYLKGKKITFRFNGKKYAAKTNKKGVAKITVKKNVLKKLRKGKKVTYQATYLKDTVKKSVKVR